MKTASDSHFLRSSLREKVVEHLFLGELLRFLWTKGARDIGVLRSEVDDCGYDLVLGCAGAWRHVQLKASHRSAKTARVPVNIGLTRVPSGCIVWVFFDADTLELGPYLWLGGPPSTQLTTRHLGERLGRHSRADRLGIKHERQNIRVVSRTKFAKLETISHLAHLLFEPGQ